MNSVTLMSAIVKRGPVLCPGCRESHCDYCGFIYAWGVKAIFDDGMYICERCLYSERVLDGPKNSRVVLNLPEGHPLRANEITDFASEGLDGGLSICTNLNKSLGKIVPKGEKGDE